MPEEKPPETMGPITLRANAKSWMHQVADLKQAKGELDKAARHFQSVKDGVEETERALAVQAALRKRPINLQISEGSKEYIVRVEFYSHNIDSARKNPRITLEQLE